MLETIANLDWGAIWPYIAVGFAAQLVDGALGMAFGVICSTLLVSVMGVRTCACVRWGPFRGNVHHRRIGHQPYLAQECGLETVQPHRHPGRDRRLYRGLFARQHPYRGRAAVWLCCT